MDLHDSDDDNKPSSTAEWPLNSGLAESDSDSEASDSSSVIDDEFLSDSDSSFEKLIGSLRIKKQKTSKQCDHFLDEADSDGEISSKDNSSTIVSYRSTPSQISPCGSTNGTPIVQPQTKDFENSTHDISGQGNVTPWRVDTIRKEVYLESDSLWPSWNVPSVLFDKLYDYQIDGVKFLASLHQKSIGGVLGDDMGMGKTFMTVAFLAGLFRTQTIRSVLIVSPLSVLRSWKAEFDNVFKSSVLNARIQIISSDMNRHKRVETIRRVLNGGIQKPAVIITSYAMVRELALVLRGNKTSFWDYVVLDEGHTIKNHKSQISNSCRTVCENKNTRRLLLSGTPIMNNLKELWAIFDWATSGKVLGTRESFNSTFSKTIEDARNKNASFALTRSADVVNRRLQCLLKPYFLQRSKADFLQDKLSTKTEVVIWTHISDMQRQMYQRFLSKDRTVNLILRGERDSPLQAITWLKQLCGHPMMVEKDNCSGLFNSVNQIVAASSKLQILVSLLEKLRSDNHRTLIFSQSVRMLDIIQRVLETRSFVIGRIDGATKGGDRQLIVDAFNAERSSMHVMLLSTKAAGVGLTLTGADRVVVYDPSWTPAEDAQAVDRCFRIGQTKPVVVFRMIAAGTVEEKMYEKQIFKDGIRRTVFSEGKAVQRYFDVNELSQMFKLADPGVCDVMEKVHDLKTDWDSHSFLLNHPDIVGLSRHDGFYHPTEPCEYHESQTTLPPPKIGKIEKILDSKEETFIPLGSKIRFRGHDAKDVNNENRENDKCSTSTKEILDETDKITAILRKSFHVSPVSGLNSLLDLVEKEDCLLVGEVGRQVHTRIAVLSHSLGLLD